MSGLGQKLLKGTALSDPYGGLGAFNRRLVTNTMNRASACKSPIFALKGSDKEIFVQVRPEA